MSDAHFSKLEDRSQFDRSAAALFNGTITSDELAQLESLAAADPALLSELVSLLSIDAQLRRFAQGTTAASRVESMLSVTQEQEAAVELVSSEAISGSSNEQSQVSENKSHPLSSYRSPLRNVSLYLTRHKLGTGIAAGLLAVAVIVSSAAVTYLPGVAEQKKPQAEAPVEWIALLNDTHEAMWIDGTEPPARLMPGQRLAISAGLLEIEYRTGARVIVEGPAEFTVGDRSQGTGVRNQESDIHPSSFTLHPSNNSGYLALGKLTARVEGEEAKGFAINTPSARVEDFGTEFGVEVNRKGEAEFVVLSGDVDVVRKNADGSEQRMRLVKNEAAIVTRRSGRIKRRTKVDVELLAEYRRRLDAGLSHIQHTQLNPFTNGGFDDTPYDRGWRTSGTEVVDGSAFGWAGAQAGTASAAHTSDNASYIYQSFTTVKGRTYDLSYYLLRANTNKKNFTYEIDVFDGAGFGGTKLFSRTIADREITAAQTWTRFTGDQFTATSSSSTIRFRDPGTVNVGAAVDSVSITESPISTTHVSCIETCVVDIGDSVSITESPISTTHVSMQEKTIPVH